MSAVSKVNNIIATVVIQEHLCVSVSFTGSQRLQATDADFCKEVARPGLYAKIRPTICISHSSTFMMIDFPLKLPGVFTHYTTSPQLLSVMHVFYI